MALKISLVASVATTSFDNIKTENLPKDAGGLSAYFNAVKAQEIKNMFKTSVKAERLIKKKKNELRNV